MKLQVTPVTAYRSSEPFRLFSEAFEAANHDSVVRAAFAYVTLSGVQDFLTHVGVSENWNARHKQLLVGIHNAITEPSALEMLRLMPQSEVRIFIPGSRLTATVFNAKPVFHPKVLAIADTQNDLQFLQVGSMNMTSSAMSSRPKNYEFSLAVEADQQVPLDPEHAFNTWWAHLWDQSRPVNSKLISSYAELRRQVLEINPILRATAEIPLTIGRVQYLFFEVGAASGPPNRRHQIEFPEALVKFFGNVTRNRRDLALQQGLQVWNARPLSYKQTSYGVEIWRLGMPTQTADGPPIAERVIRFERTENPEVFKFEVVDAGSSTFHDWVRSANLIGHIGETRGQRARRYGFY